MRQAIQNIIEVSHKNREDKKLTYEGYNFTVQYPRKKFYGDSAKEVQRFCWEKWKEGFTQQEIATMLGIKSHASVINHIKNYHRNAVNR